MDTAHKYMYGESDVFIGNRKRFGRTLLCSMQGYFPVLVKTGPNSLAAIFRVGAPHMGPHATLAVSNSQDGGICWSDPVEIVPRGNDSRNAAFGVNSKGELIAGFLSAADLFYKELVKGKGYVSVFETMQLDENLEKIKDACFTFCCKSSDQGKTWSAPSPIKTDLLIAPNPYGKMIMDHDNTLYMSLYGTSKTDKKTSTAILMRSYDNGFTWEDETVVAEGYNETSYAFLSNDSMIAAARSLDGGSVSILHSNDKGRTWSAPVQITRSGLNCMSECPADIIKLSSGKVLLTFGRRIRPMGCGALWSDDDGYSFHFDREILLAGDGVRNLDLGYPSTVQLDSGKIVTALYYASGSDMSADFGGWGDVSCQVIHYYEEDIIY